MPEERPRILFVLHLPPPVHGAATVGECVRRSSVVNRAFAARYVNLSTSRTLDEVGRRPLLKLLRYAQILPRVIWHLVTFRPRLCYVTLTARGWGFYKDFLVVVLAKLSGARLVYHMHNKGVRLRQRKPLDDFLYRIAFHRAQVVLLSPRLYSDVSKYVPPERASYCPNGVPEIAAVTARKSRSDSLTELLFLSNLSESKGIFVLLDACKMLRDRGSSFQCRIVGEEGDIRSDDILKRVDALGLGSAVRYVGPKYGAEKVEAFASADIFVFPTYSEVFGLVILEAMQFSLPVISTVEGAIPDLVEHGRTGLLVPPRNTLALAEEIDKLVTDPELRTRMGVAGREKYHREFRMEAFEARFTQVLQHCAENNR